MAQINCLRCKQPIDSSLEQCPSCSEKVTQFQRTYSAKLIDGKYQILDRLGVGGMGEIFKVRHIHLNELRVIKIMRPNVAADDQGLQRFLQEARTSTQIKHKNLAMLYDFAQLDDGSYYMVWEFIDGINIQKWIQTNGPMPSRLTIEISIQSLHGLDHLHSMGLIHRDISPENIMLSQDHHGKLMVKVIDFGIAKQLGEGEGGQGLTQTGMFLGKLKYASPEQAGFLKEGEQLDPRSDLYSFGIVMYEMLAGRAPFQATNPHGYILKHVTEKPVPIAEMNPQIKVPAQVESLVFKSLEKSRDARFATAAEFASALEAVRNTVAPDQKYGLGERMVTLSGQKTLADLPKYTTGPSPTVGGAAPTQQQTMGGSNDATVMERGLTSPTLSGQATVVERQVTMGGSNDATMVERLPTQSAPTQLEAKGSFGEAAPTVMERQYVPAPAKKTNVMLMGGIAAAVVLALGIAAFMVMKKPPAAPAPTPGAASGATVVATAASGTSPIPTGQGALLLSASTWADLERIIGPKGDIDLSEEKKSTPTRIDLDPGKYTVIVNGPTGKQTLDVQISPGQRLRKNVDTGVIDFNALEKEVNQ